MERLTALLRVASSSYARNRGTTNGRNRRRIPINDKNFQLPLLAEDAAPGVLNMSKLIERGVYAYDISHCNRSKVGARPRILYFNAKWPPKRK